MGQNEVSQTAPASRRKRRLKRFIIITVTLLLVGKVIQSRYGIPLPGPVFAWCYELEEARAKWGQDSAPGRPWTGRYVAAFPNGDPHQQTLNIGRNLRFRIDVRACFNGGGPTSVGTVHIGPDGLVELKPTWVNLNAGCETSATKPRRLHLVESQHAYFMVGDDHIETFRKSIAAGELPERDVLARVFVHQGTYNR